ncbi:MAG TPA: LAGLIDADG family homing endonuclease [Blastocatellia bacterium]|nr:LAGLIDADG family homing endonuclease [Blastocatellia bacterium]
MFRLEKLEISGFKSFADRTTLTFGEGITAVVGPNGCGKCVDGATLVTLADGRDVPIRELVDAALKDSNSVEALDDGLLTRQNPSDVAILSLNPETLRLEPRRVTAFIKREATPYLLRIRTRAGREVTATPYHPLFTLEDGRLRTLKAEELKVGVRLALPRRLPVSGGEVEMSPLRMLEQFQAGDNLFVPHSDQLRAWALSAHTRFGTWTGWARAANVSDVQLRGFLNKQSVGTNTLVSLSHSAQSLPPLDGRLKSHGNGEMRLPSAFSPELARFLGLVIAEGRNTSSNQVWFVNSDPAINDEYERLAHTLFGLRVRRLHYKSNAEDSLIFSHALCKTLERLFGFSINSSSSEKEIPSQVFESERATQWAFLSGLFEGDAYISVQGGSGAPRPPFIEYTTASPRLAEQVVALLLRLGIFSLLRSRQKYASNTAEKRRRTYYSVLIYGTEQLCRAAENLSFVGEKRAKLSALRKLSVASNPNLDLIPGITPLVKQAARVAGVNVKAHRSNHPKLAAYVESRCEASRGGLLEVTEQIERSGKTPDAARGLLDRFKKLASSDIYWDEIVSVEQVAPSDEWVYDLSIAETHNFVAGNIIVHNSNVAESISWVLGEQSAKNLRGGKMEDVIFNGTRDRKPTGMAEVLLTLVAVKDIAAKDSDGPPADDDHEYEDAVENAERAAEAARSLVHELTPQQPVPEQPANEQPAPEPAGELTAQADSSAVVNDSPRVAEKRAKSHDRSRAQRRKRRTVAIMAGERITVGRRLYRTGDSEYLMNGRPCLLRDIQDLFAGTGLGGAHYAIIEQGRIGQILSSKPLDRRALIEEAAGITKFKSRKRAAELKLESAKQNLTRLNDIISEIERQVNSLKRQAQKARRYRRMREEVRGLQKVVFTADYYRLTEAIDRVARELEAASVKQSEIDSIITAHETEHRAVSAEARAGEDRLAGLRETAAAIELEADRARNRRAFEQQQITELTTRIEELERDQQALDTRLASLDDAAERHGVELEALETEHAAEQADLRAREGQYQEEFARLRQAEAEIEQMRQRLLTEIGHLERLRNLSAGLEEALRRLELKQTSLQAEMERASSRLEEASSEYARVGGEAEGNRARLVALTGRIRERAKTLSELRNEATAFRQELEAIHAERTSAAHRLESLEDLDEHHAHYSDAVQFVLSPEQAARINALGPLADFVEVEAQYERLIESLFGRELQSVLVPTIDDALAGVESIKGEGLGRGAFLVVGLHGGEGDPADETGERESQAYGELEAREPDDLEPQVLLGYDDLVWSDEDYIAADHQLPAASIPLEEFLEASYDSEPDTFAPDIDVEDADRQQLRRFDEDEARTASRFQLDVLRAIDLMGLRPEIKSVVERAFPDKCAASVVPDIEAALHLSIENASRIYVTYNGEQVVNGRLIVTGAQAGQRGVSLLGLKREIKQLRVQTEVLRADEERMAEELTRAQQRLEGIEGEVSQLDLELREHEKTTVARDSQLEGLARDLERASQHVRVVEAEMEQSAEECAELSSRITALASELQTAEASRDAVQSAITTAQAEFIELRAHVEQLAEQLSSVRASVAARAERLQSARGEARRIESEAEEFRSRINRNRVELYESYGRIEQLRASTSEGDTATARFDAERAELDGEIARAAESLDQARGRTDELEALLAELRQSSSAAHDRRGQIEVERARVESEAEHLARICYSELAMSLEDVVTSVELGLAAQTQLSEPSEISNLKSQISDDEEAETIQTQPPAPDAEAARARLDELKAKLDDIGPVNMMALEELEEAEQRYAFLSEQRRDILESIKMTEEALTEIKRRSRERFRHAFTHINENFQRMFVELFGGGRGEMILIDEEDVLESGIDLIAQPPGKRLQNVLLLSGGEKAMAAIALVLAIFQYRPSPFCILDEVDAPLDEMNVGRFSNKVVEMSRDTQFLVITHNKRTMEAALALYGVTMEEPGVSKLVSVKFE